VGGENVQLHKRVLASVGLASGVPGAVWGPARVSRPDFASGEGACLRRDVVYLVRYGRLRAARSTRQRRCGSEVIVRVKKLSKHVFDHIRDVGSASARCV